MLLVKKVIILAKYSDFANVFFEKSNLMLKQTGANGHAIMLEKGKQPPYEPIYSLEQVEFKTLKTYININLANGLIKASKSSVGVLILFVEKPNCTICLCVNYQGLNNLTIKNWYLLSLLGKFLD